MPRCDGVCATRLIKAEMPECKVVILTVSEDEQDLFEAVKSGASGYLLKRVDATEFFIYLNELQAGHPPFSPGLAEMILKEFSHQAFMPEAQTAQSDPIATQANRARVNESQGIPLSPRQIQILALVAQGQTYSQVAVSIGIAERTVKYHMAEILNHLHLQNRAQVIAYAAQSGLVPRRRDEDI
jgi:DNA-binding NarL/FixJ family response regulator